MRLLGVRTANLVEDGEPEQLSILDLKDWPGTQDEKQNKIQPSREKMKKLDEALDAIKHKYGNDVVERASLMKRKTRTVMEYKETGHEK